MNASDSDLLRQFARDGSEAAFAELVRRHVDLVYSAALRQVGPDVQAAEDVTQVVFTDLARKAGKLGHLTSLTGWLYGCTRFEAMQHHRTEFRRTTRETAAHAMSEILAAATPEPDWNRLQPVLDAAMCDLPDDDREAVLMRYFEKRPLAEVGARLGLSENTARMRVDRALDKLHAALGKRGITSTAAALGTLLGTNAVAGAPAGIADRVTRAASSQWRRKRPALAGGGPGWLIPVTVALLLGIGGLMWMNRQGWLGTKDNGDVVRQTGNASSAGTNSETSAASPTDSQIIDQSITPPIEPVAEGAGRPGPELRLKVITKDTGQSVPNVSVRSKSRIQTLEHSDTTATSRAGEARIKLWPDASQVTLATETEGFADMVVRWFPEKGDSIPTTYVLRLERGVLLGGTVVDSDDKPVSGASLGFSIEPDPRTKSGESLEFQNFWTTTGEDGRWKVQRVAESMLERIDINVTATNFVHAFLDLGPSPEDVALLRRESHVLKLARTVIFRGIVVNKAGEPISGARLVMIDASSKNQERTSAFDGSFEFPNIAPGIVTCLAVRAEGYAPKMLEITRVDPAIPLRVVLDEGATLRLRLVNQAGEPVTNALVSSSRLFSAALFMPPLVEKHSDPDGRIVWTNAPRETCQIDIGTKDYLAETAISVTASESEKQIVLFRPPVIRGRVTDARTGRLIPKFHLALGWENLHLLTPRSNIEVSTIDRFHLDFTNGVFRHELKERLLLTPDPRLGFMVQFEAEGYQKNVSRPIGYGEGEVTLDTALEPAADIDVTVLDPAGNPAAGAELGLPSLGARFTLRSGHLSIYNRDLQKSVLRVDADGKLKITRQTDVDRIIVAHPTGFLDTGIAALEGDPVIRLQPWGRIEGNIKSAGGHFTGTVSVTPLRDGRNDFSYQIGSAVDATGRFEISQIPPGEVVVEQKVRDTKHPMPDSMSSIRSTQATVVPGEATRITFGGDYQIKGRLRVPPGMSIPAGTVWTGHLSTPFPRPPAGMSEEGPEYYRWLNSPEIARITSNAEHLTMVIRADGRFSIEGAKARIYHLMVSVTSPASDTAPASALAGVDMEVRISEDQPSTETDLGDVMLTAIRQ